MKLLKKTLTITALLLILNTAYGQIGINTNEPDESAVLEIFSDTKGILIPRLETSVRLAYGNDNPANGVIVYDVQLSKFFVWRRTESGTETKGGHWLYINPWDVDETNHTMSLSSTVASSVTIDGDLFLNNIDFKGTLTFNGSNFLANKSETLAGIDFKAISPQSLKDHENWQTLTLINGWAGTVKYRKTTDGMIHIKAWSLSGYLATSSFFGVLPEGYRPLECNYFNPQRLVSDTYYKNCLMIKSNGEMRIYYYEGSQQYQTIFGFYESFFID